MTHKDRPKLINRKGKITCLKRKIATEKEAKTILKSARKTGMKEYYQCPHCDSWHLTSKRNWRK